MDFTKKDITITLLTIFFVFLFGIAIGFKWGMEAPLNDCIKMQQFRVGEIVFKCEVKSADNIPKTPIPAVR